MFTALVPLILASGSPRRRDMLARLGLSFTIMVPAIDETRLRQEDPATYVRRLAALKAEAIANLHPNHCIISGDTAVIFGDHLLGKPADSKACLDMLQMLAGNQHQVLTALSVCYRPQQLNAQIICSTQVTFHPFDQRTLQAYVATAEGMDKAGGYGLQGKGAFLVQSIQGSPSCVIGLPLAELTDLLLQHHLIQPAC